MPMGQHDGLDRTEIDAEGAVLHSNSYSLRFPIKGEAMTGAPEMLIG